MKNEYDFNFQTVHLHDSMSVREENSEYNTSEKTIGCNKIYYGVPGCGKSYKIQAMLEYKNEFQNEANTFGITAPVSKDNIFRTTFYLDYSNVDFVGQILPVVKEKNVTYKFVPGPFTKALEKALTKRNETIFLVIEEINRGNAAAIFGDLFQLLDRKNGISRYPITNEFIESYFEEKNLTASDENKIAYVKGQITIPNNLVLLATMNTSDQNVFPLDTAFKRRWDMEQVLSDWDKCYLSKLFLPCSNITWKDFAETINEIIITPNHNTDIVIGSDKQMGAYFANEEMLSNEEFSNDKNKLKKFISNVIEYLYNDVTKFDHEVLFDKKITFDNIYKKAINYNPENNVNFFDGIFNYNVGLENNGTQSKKDNNQR